MSLRRSIIGLHRQAHSLSLSKSSPFSMNNISTPSTAAAAARYPMGRSLSSIPFALTQRLKPKSINLGTDRSLSSLDRTTGMTRVPFARGYSTNTFLPKTHLLYHINQGMEEILADYVHQEMTRNLMVISLGLFQFIVIKDVFLFLC
ncbi:unnamed protein product [Cochlearia groenlandica]